MFQLPDNPDAPPAVMRRVLVVDDEPTLRLGFAYALANSRTTVETAANGRDALDQIARSHFDIIVLDLRMPKMDGMGVIEALRGPAAALTRGAGVPIILCSELTEPQAALGAIRHGVVDFLLKPMRPAELREAVEFVLHPEQHPLSSALQKVREQRPEQAIRILENQVNSGTRAVYWLKVLEFIQNASIGEEESELAELVRICFPNLAFNPTMSQ